MKYKKYKTFFVIFTIESNYRNMQELDAQKNNLQIWMIVANILNFKKCTSLR